ncbi:TRAFAC clade GTPase domain-containing protein [Acidipropionibacterium acidipropionici]|uniref:TRAFAC clade GTPase domain-containing protein n=2 Tax=Acidipropionibacterium acidipropionici TaxID=1748 RepID=UPI00056ABCBE|nr:hypothetical protein [Acidipropionibacterium acidipropionici]ALN16435.1 hypothetical protein ASQ49_15435 [Acidipropionibacterium acidipropionici]
MGMKVKDQHIAVFGESGSGKTVLLSSFYGASQEAGFVDRNKYQVLADDMAQGLRLAQNYLRMDKEARVPPTNRFGAQTYSFTLKPDGDTAPAGRPFDALRLIWHDYPGQWFAEDPSSEKESARRLRTVSDLLQSDVAIVLVDGQKLVDYAGEEEKYLKSMLWALCNGLLNLKGDILKNRKKLRTIPRIWILALSKADLHPDLDAPGFRDLIIEKVGDDVSRLQKTLRGFVADSQAFSLGEDYMLLSSAKFEPGKILVADRVGVDLITPVACLLPMERVAQWIELGIHPKAVQALLERSGVFAALLDGSVGAAAGKLFGKVPRVGKLLAPIAVPALQGALKLATAKAKAMRDAEVAKHDVVTAIVTQFRMDLEDGVRDGLLVKRP